MTDQREEELERAERIVLDQLPESSLETSSSTQGRDGSEDDLREHGVAPASATERSRVSGPVASGCQEPDSPIDVEYVPDYDGGSKYRLSTEEWEDDWFWYLDGRQVGSVRTTTVVVEGPGRYSVAVHRDERPGSRGRGGLIYETTICNVPIPELERLDETGPDLLEYLDANEFPERPVEWFSLTNTDANAAIIEWSIEATDGLGTGEPEVLDQGEPTTPVRFRRPGEFELTVSMTVGEITARRVESVSKRVDPEISIEILDDQVAVDDEEAADWGLRIEATATHRFPWSNGLEFQWYLNDQETPVATGPSATFSISSLIHTVRLEVEDASGHVVETSRTVASGDESRMGNGASIVTDLAAAPVETDHAEEIGARITDDPNGFQKNDVIVLEEPQVVRFTTSESELPVGMRPSYNWTVQYSERYREGYDEPYPREEPSDMVVDYAWDEYQYQPLGGSELLYPFSEPGWYTVQLELTSVHQTDTMTTPDTPWNATEVGPEFPEKLFTDPEYTSDVVGFPPTRYDVMFVYVRGLDDPTDPWPDYETVHPDA